MNNVSTNSALLGNHRPGGNVQLFMKRLLVPLFVALGTITAACGSTDGTSEGSLPEITTVVTEPTPATEPAPVTEPSTPTSDPTPRTDSLEQASADLEAARALWATNGPSSYRMVTQPLCFCVQEEWAHTVVDGVVTEHVAVGDESFIDPGPLTMTDLFDMIQNAIDSDPVSVAATYDTTTGAVDSFFVDVDEMIADEEYGIAVLTLE